MEEPQVQTGRSERGARWEERLSKWAHIAQLIQLISIGPIIVGITAYLWNADERAKQAEESLLAQREAARYQAWQAINSATGKPGNGGRIDALEYLNADGALLYGVDLSHAFLSSVKLPGAKLADAILDSARMDGADLQNADLWFARMQGTILSHADLDSARLEYADLRGAYLNYSSGDNILFNYANLQGAQLYNSGIMHGSSFYGADLRYALLTPGHGHWDAWRSVKEMRMANVYGVRGVPEAFFRWAVDTMGAVEIASDSAWENRKQAWYNRSRQIDEACASTTPDAASNSACKRFAETSDSAFLALMKRAGMARDK